MCDVHVALHQLRHSGSQRALFGLEDVAEHLQVVASSPESLAHHSVELVAVVVLVCERKLWQQLVVAF